MGEAKRRKSKDPFYGKVPKAGKGIVLSNPIEIDEQGRMFVHQSDLDPCELRRAVLFWDRIQWPESRFFSMVGSRAEVDYLTQLGIMTRPLPNKTDWGGKDAHIHFAKGHLQQFIDNEKNEPGLWSVSEGRNSFLFSQPGFIDTRAPLIELYRSIPIPEADVPLEALLEFKERRLDEVRHLVLTIDRFYSDLLKAEDQVFEMKRLSNEIDHRCADIIKVAKESGLKFGLSDWGINFSGDIDVAKVLSGALGLGTFGQPELGALVGGAVGLELKVGGGFSLGTGDREQLKASPFRFVASMHNEPI
ncbi:hypothetical protein ROA7450_04215 [Roseovarius albus]|uniref:Uncharacterized protein n=1 Tax=Roseovarius albus TaxID=1247867 RepID=A0A1X7AAV0_9RHOB|nr:DUF6236 family protein [Roseovarius albus]SLN74331.1 hypothetical protein ROA7450_04215 [Roseovarius albus]